MWQLRSSVLRAAAPAFRSRRLFAHSAPSGTPSGNAAPPSQSAATLTFGSRPANPSSMDNFQSAAVSSSSSSSSSSRSASSSPSPTPSSGNAGKRSTLWQLLGLTAVGAAVLYAGEQFQELREYPPWSFVNREPPAPQPQLSEKRGHNQRKPRPSQPQTPSTPSKEGPHTLAPLAEPQPQPHPQAQSQPKGEERSSAQVELVESVRPVEPAALTALSAQPVETGTATVREHAPPDLGQEQASEAADRESGLSAANASNAVEESPRDSPATGTDQAHQSSGRSKKCSSPVIGSCSCVPVTMGD